MTQHRIVVADDDPIVLKFLSAVFQDEGFQVMTAEDGEKALQVIRDMKPDLVILDLVMPYRDGFEVCQHMRAAADTRQIPVIILSMKEKEQDALRAFEVGADDYIRKPFNALELVARARKLVAAAGRKA
ncbi:MAG TPA: response regulator [Candidatus Polarisedimenticolia bacterium]|nr:response regulator [Candidatus Polarisedimenticolia bacterium]